MTQFKNNLSHTISAGMNFFIVSFLVVLLLSAAFFPLSAARAQSASDQREFSVTGRIVAWRAGKVSTRVPGLVKALRVRAGQRVERGEVLAILDTSQLETELALAQSELEVARAKSTVAKSEEALRINVFNRQKRLKRSPAFQIARFDDANLRLKIAAANRLRAAAEVASKQANLKRKQVDIQLATIRAPFGGVIQTISAQTGSFITAEIPHLLDMVDDTSLEIEIDIPAQQFALFRPGQTFSFSAKGGKRSQARVRAALPVVNRRTQTRPVRLTPLDKATVSMLAPGQDVTIYWRGP